MLTDDQNNYTWTCSNPKDGVIQDNIFFTKTPAGEVPTGLPTTLALAPSDAASWGSFHVCDPSVVRGSFIYFGAAYSYAMFVTGTPRNASADNSVGVAFSNEPAGPWIVAPAPVIANLHSPSAWGAGQPSVVCVNGSRVLLAWSDGGPTLSRTRAAWVTLASQADATGPGWSVGIPWVVSNDGLRMTSGGPDFLHNADFSYDPASHLVYVARPVGPYPTSGSVILESAVELDRLPMADFLTGTGTWSKVGEDITSEVSGAGRNDNPGIVRKMDGTLPVGTVSVVVTLAADGVNPPMEQWWPASLWTYRLREFSVPR